VHVGVGDGDAGRGRVSLFSVLVRKARYGDGLSLRVGLGHLYGGILGDGGVGGDRVAELFGVSVPSWRGCGLEEKEKEENIPSCRCRWSHTESPQTS
jgi:hypothetical protein